MRVAFRTGELSHPFPSLAPSGDNGLLFRFGLAKLVERDLDLAVAVDAAANDSPIQESELVENPDRFLEVTEPNRQRVPFQRQGLNVSHQLNPPLGPRGASGLGPRTQSTGPAGTSLMSGGSMPGLTRSLTP